MYVKFFKRFLDFILSLCAVIVLSPVLVFLTVVGAITMKGNPFFVQKRPGKNEKIISSEDATLIDSIVKLFEYERTRR